MRKLLYELTIPALLSICFIVITAIVSQSDKSITPIGQFCFLFNAIPADIGFLGDDSWIISLYYSLLFIALALLFWWIGNLTKLLLERSNTNRLK
jgi:hypothetical protein